MKPQVTTVESGHSKVKSATLYGNPFSSWAQRRGKESNAMKFVPSVGTTMLSPVGTTYKGDGWQTPDRHVDDSLTFFDPHVPFIELHYDERLQARQVIGPG
jgi:hypothetical protein